MGRSGRGVAFFSIINDSSSVEGLSSSSSSFKELKRNSVSESDLAKSKKLDSLIRLSRTNRVDSSKGGDSPSLSASRHWRRCWLTSFNTAFLIFMYCIAICGSSHKSGGTATWGRISTHLGRFLESLRFDSPNSKMSLGLFKFMTLVKNFSTKSYFVVSTGTDNCKASKSWKLNPFVSSRGSTTLPALIAGGRGDVIAKGYGV